MKTALVNCFGFLGDTLIQSCVAKPLVKEKEFDNVYFGLPFPQTERLLERNPYITGVFDKNTGHVPRGIQVDEIFNMGSVNQYEPATIQYKRMCGVKDNSIDYEIYTDPELDSIYQAIHDDSASQPVVSYQANWKEKAFLFTEEEYERAIDVPYKGYGGKIRDIDKIINLIKQKSTMLLVSVGFPAGVSQHSHESRNSNLYDKTASLIKSCDWFIGSESGLSNLSAGIGTKCIITTDYIAQLYGRKGIISKNLNPQMGPATYFPDAGHVHLNPYLTDEQVAEQIVEIIESN